MIDLTNIPQDKINALTQLERNVLGAALFKKDINMSTIRAFADDMNVSTSVVSSLCKKIGYQGFNDFKIELKKAHNNAAYNSLQSKSLREAADNLLYNVQNEIDALPFSDIKQTLYLLKDCDNLIIYSGGITEGVATEFATRTRSLGINTIVTADVDFVQESLAQQSFKTFINKNVLLVLSFDGAIPGYDEIIKIPRLGKGVIVQNEVQEKSTYVDFDSVIKLAAEGDKPLAIQSRVMMHIILDIIYLALLDEHKK